MTLDTPTILLIGMVIMGVFALAMFYLAIKESLSAKPTQQRILEDQLERQRPPRIKKVKMYRTQVLGIDTTDDYCFDMRLSKNTPMPYVATCLRELADKIDERYQTNRMTSDSTTP